MKLIINNIGKVKKADIKLDGITVICGDNNSGKSTIGKVLFANFNAMCDFQSKIEKQKLTQVISYFRRSFYNTKHVDFRMANKSYRVIASELLQFIDHFEGEYTSEDIHNFLQTFSDLDCSKDMADDIFSLVNTSNEELLNEYIFRYFMDIFNGQLKNESANKRVGSIQTIFRNGTNTIKFYTNKCTLNQETPILHPAYYIDNPFVINYLNSNRINLMYLGELERNVVDAIFNAEVEQSADKMVDIFDTVANKKKLDDIRNIIKRAFNGNTVIKNGMYFYHEDITDIDFRNISTGLKSFALIERLLESGKLKPKDVLILDEPEIHLHPDWQLVYAELIVVLQKVFDLTILLVTHSFHFLESISFFMDKYDIANRGNYYIPTPVEGGYSFVDSEDNIKKIMKSLSQATFKLSDMKFDYDMERQNGTEEDTE